MASKMLNRHRRAFAQVLLSSALLVAVAVVVSPHARAESAPPPKQRARKADAAAESETGGSNGRSSDKDVRSTSDDASVGKLPPLDQRVAALQIIEAAGGTARPDIEKLRAAGVRGNWLSPKHRFQAAYFYRVAITDKILDALAAFPELERLILSDSGVTDDQLARLPLRNLRYLELISTPISDKGVKHLRSLAKLQSLLLDHTAVTGRGLAPLTSLETLGLDQTAVDDEGLADLAALPKLGTLMLNKTGIGDGGLAHLQTTTSLRHLDLRGTKVTDGGLISLQGLTNLTTVRLDDTRIGDAGIEVIERLPAIRELTLGNTGITDVSASAIAQWIDMTRLDLSHTAVSNLGLKRLATLKKLGFLNLAGTTITDPALLALGGMGELKELDLADTPITDAGLAYLHPLRSLSRLDLSRTRISDPRLDGLKPLPRLASLRVEGTEVTALDVFWALPQTNPNVIKILAALGEETELDFANQPLLDVLEYLQQRHDIPLQVDKKSLSDAGVDLFKTDITLNRKGLTLREAFESILNPLGLTFAVRHEVLFVAAEPLPETASDVPVLPEGQRLSRKLAEAFMQRTELDFADEQLVRVIEFLAKKHNIDMQLDPASLTKAGIGFDVPITRSIKGITLKSALELILDDLDLTCVAEGEKVTIRTKAGQ